LINQSINQSINISAALGYKISMLLRESCIIVDALEVSGCSSQQRPGRRSIRFRAGPYFLHLNSVPQWPSPTITRSPPRLLSFSPPTFCLYLLSFLFPLLTVPQTQSHVKPFVLLRATASMGKSSCMAAPVKSINQQSYATRDVSLLDKWLDPRFQVS
jgi:hypothetical protein